MGPHRLIHSRKGYLTETVFDEHSGRFVERPWPPSVRVQLNTPEGRNLVEFVSHTDVEDRSC